MSTTNIPELNAAEWAAKAESALEYGTSPSDPGRGAPAGSMGAAFQAVGHALIAIHHDLRRIADGVEGLLNYAERGK